MMDNTNTRIYANSANMQMTRIFATLVYSCISIN